MALLAVRNSGQPRARSQKSRAQSNQKLWAKARPPYMRVSMAAQVIITARRPKRSQRLPARGCRGRPPRAVRPMMAPTTATETPSLPFSRIAV